jgi:hypothetical protein
MIQLKNRWTYLDESCYGRYALTLFLQIPLIGRTNMANEPMCDVGSTDFVFASSCNQSYQHGNLWCGINTSTTYNKADHAL